MAFAFDNFNRADSSTALGTTSDGLWTWRTLLGTLGISTNQATAIAVVDDGHGDFVAQGLLDNMPSDASVQAILAAQGTGWLGLIFRVTDKDHYWTVGRTAAGPGQLLKFDTGVYTQLGSNFTVNVGDTLGAAFAGPSISVLVNGGQALTTSDSYLMSATSHGVFIGSTSGTFALDDFTINNLEQSPKAVVVQKAALTRAANW